MQQRRVVQNLPLVDCALAIMLTEATSPARPRTFIETGAMFSSESFPGVYCFPTAGLQRTAREEGEIGVST